MNRGLEILHDAYTHSGYRVVLLMGLLVVTGISDGVSMALLYPLIEVAGIGVSADAAPGTLSIAFQRMFDWFGIEQTLVNISSILIVSFLIQALLFTAQNWLLLDIQKKYIASWQKRLFGDFIAAEWPYFVAQKSGGMVSAILVECSRTGAAFFAIVQLIVGLVVLGIYLAIAFVVSWKLMLYLLAAALVLFTLVMPIRQATRRYGAELGTINSEMTATLGEMLSGAKLIKTSAGESVANALMGGQVERLRHNLIWGAFLPTTLRSIFEFGAILIIIAALLFSIKYEQAGPANLLLLVALVARLLPRLMNVQIFHNMLNLTAPSFFALRNMQKKFAAHREELRSAAAGGVDPETLLPAEIKGRDLVMHYGDTMVLDQVSFVVRPGQVVGFVGPSGAGKTTLIDSIMGLVMPGDGSVMIGDVALRDIDLQAWRRKIGYVSQDTFLFHDTIANNIRWNVPDASMELVEMAARKAGLDPFISSLPSKYQTVVGDRGAKLSGGQRQRISMARALVRQPALLILDEATSALDSLSEQEVMDALQSLRGKMSIIIVAHRFAAVRDADYIYVLDGGRVVEQGTWEALSGRKALFHRLMEAQTVREHR